MVADPPMAVAKMEPDNAINLAIKIDHPGLLNCRQEKSGGVAQLDSFDLALAMADGVVRHFDALSPRMVCMQAMQAIRRLGQKPVLLSHVLTRHKCSPG